MANVVVTGGAGFLGSRLARELLAAGSLDVAGSGERPLSRVTLLDRVPAPADLAADPRVTVVGGDQDLHQTKPATATCWAPPGPGGTHSQGPT